MTQTGQIGTAPFMAPELLMSNSAASSMSSIDDDDDSLSSASASSKRYNNKIDVYAFGMTVWSIWSRAEPFHAFPGTVFELFIGVCKEGLRPDVPEDMPKGIEDIVRRCWSLDPRERPSFEQIQMDLDNVKKALRAATRAMPPPPSVASPRGAPPPPVTTPPAAATGGSFIEADTDPGISSGSGSAGRNTQHNIGML